jgi:nitroreductase
MDFREAIYSRRSVREFTTEPVDQPTLQQIIDAAIQAPSAMNQQPWRFAVLRDQALLDHISRESKAFLLRTTPPGPALDHLREMVGPPEFDLFYHAPALIVIAAASESPWATEDCALAAQNLMLAARAAGLGSCWIGLAQGWLATAEGKTAIGLPASHVPIAPIVVGHPKAWPPPVPRKEAEIHWIGQ